jgi:hypothetical protein
MEMYYSQRCEEGLLITACIENQSIFAIFPLSEQFNHDLISKILLKLFYYHVRLGVVAIRALEFWRMALHSGGSVS